MSSVKWIPPLPHGWEARYDADNKAYFFIDHIHKKTQWEDPRFPGQTQQAHPQPANNSATAAASLGSLGPPGGPSRPYGAAIALKDLGPSHPRKNQQKNSRDNTHEASLTNVVDTAVVNKLKAEYPDAAKEVIIDVLALCHNNERETREQLNDFGFMSNKRKSSSHASPHHNTSAGATPTRKASDSHPLASEKSPSGKELSEGDKLRLLNQVKSLFPKLEGNVVRIALNECHHDVEKVKALLSAWEKKTQNNEHGKTASPGSGPSSVSVTATSVRSLSPPPGSLEPVGFNDAAAYKPKSFGNSQPSTALSSHTSPKRSSTDASVAQFVNQNAKTDRSSSSMISCPQHARAKQVTKMSEHLLNTTSDLLNHLATTASCCTSGDDEEEKVEDGKNKEEANETVKDKEKDKRPKQSTPVAQPTVVTSQPVLDNKSKVTSANRTKAKGPDPTLRKGPDASLLTSDYTQANGPDKSTRVGPDCSRLIGPRKAMGPDVNLRCGPQSSLLQENRNISVTTTTNILASHS